MSILVDESTRVIVQGITGSEGAFHTKQMASYGTTIVGGVVPNRGGEEIHDIPVFDTVTTAVDETGATASVVFVPPSVAADAVFEALDAELDLVVIITEGIPVHDMMRLYRRIQETETTVIGPNCPGIITPESTKLGILPGEIFSAGSVGLVSRSGTLTYELVDNLTSRGIGQSTAVGIGGDPIVGTNFVEILEEFETDPETDAVVLVGEIGGEAEEDAAAYINAKMSTPVSAFIAGRTAPPGKRMGHAGAIVSGSGTGTAEHKIQALSDAGVTVGETPREVADHIATIIQ